MQKVREIWLRKIHQSWFVVWLCVGVVAGTVLGVACRVNYLASGWFVVMSGVLFVICLVRPLLMCSVLAVLAGFLMSFVRVTEELTGENYVRGFYGVEVVVTGEIGADPETDEKQTKLKLSNLRFGEGCDSENGKEGNDVCTATRGSIYVTLTRNEDLRWGDTVTLAGEMSEGFGTYAGYMYKPRVMWWARPEPGSWILAVRDSFAMRVERTLGSENVFGSESVLGGENTFSDEETVGGVEAKLGLSYLMGMKTGLPEDLEENLRTVGLMHIVVASGAHLAILVEVARKIFGKISRFAGIMFSVVFIVIFMALVGWTPSILRAGIMAILTLVSWYVGRKIAPWRMILMVMAVTLLINPMFVINLGWLLSFASYIGIMVINPWLSRFFYGRRKPGFIGGMVLMTVSATVMTLPIVLYYYGQVSLISVIANLLILPTLPVAMGLVFLTGVVTGVPLIETAVGFLTQMILKFHIFVVGAFSGWTQFLVKIEPYQPVVFAIYGVVAVGLAVAFWRERSKRGEALEALHHKARSHH